MIDKDQLREEIIRPVLKYLEPEIPYSMTAENLLMGTCAQESLLGQFVTQCNCGPARGIFQMEPATHNDIFANFLKYNKALREKVEALMSYAVVDADPAQAMAGNLYYATAMCRVHYFRRPEALPENNLVDMGFYYKKHYNTILGAATEQDFIDNYKALVS